MAYEKRGVLRQAFGVVGLIFGFFLVIGSIFVVVAWFVWGSAQEFRAKGVDVMGQVDKRWESTRDCKDSNSNVTRTCTDFNVGYSYEVGGKTWADSGTTSYETYANLEEGERIIVRYLRDDPGNSVTSFDAETVDAMGGMAVVALIFGVLGGVFAVIGSAGLGWLIRGARRGVWLRDNGSQRGAVVLAQEETNVRVNNRVQWRIRWKDDSGDLGQSRGQARENLPQVGARIVVYADPSGRQAAVWEGDSGTR